MVRQLLPREMRGIKTKLPEDINTTFKKGKEAIRHEMLVREIKKNLGHRPRFYKGEVMFSGSSMNSDFF